MLQLIGFFVVLLLHKGQCNFLGDPGVLGQMANTYGSGFDTLNGDNVQIYMRGNVMLGVVAEQSDLRVLGLVELMLPSVYRSLGISSSNVDNPFNFKIANFSLDTERNEWSVGTREFPTLTLVPDFLLLSDVTVVVTMELSPEVQALNDKFSIRGFALAGVWQVGDINFDFKISQQGDQFYFRGIPNNGEIPVGELIRLLGEALLPAEMEGPLRAAGLDRFSLQNSRFVGTYGVDGFAIGLSGNPTITGWGSFRCHLLVTRYKKTALQNARTAVTIAINLPSFSLAGLIKKISGLDVTDVPLIGSLTVPETGLIISTGSLTPNFLPEVLDGILTQVRPINKGVTLIAAIPIIPDKPAVVFSVSIGPGGLQFSFVDPGAALKLSNLLTAIIPDFDVDELDLPPGVSDLLDVQLYGFQLTIAKKIKTLAIELKFGDSLEIIPGIATILNPSILINITLSKPRKTVFKADGFWQFGSADFPVTIQPAALAPISPAAPNRDKRTAKGFILSGEGNDLNVAAILQKMDADFLPDELSSVLQSASMADFSILRPSFEIPVGTGAKGFQFKLAGTPQIAGWAGATVNLVVSKQTGKAAMAVGIELGNIGFADVIEKLTKKNVKALSLLDRSLKVAVVISSKTMDGVTLSGETLSRIPIQRGLSFVAVFTFPDDCQGDAFCDFAKGALGSDASLQITTTITSLKQILISAGVNNIRLGDGLILSEAALEFAFGVETYVGIRAELALTNPPISFTGAVRFGLQGLELSMIMKGIWKRAFGINFLAFGNAILSVALKPGVPLAGIEVGGEVRVGKIDSGKEIIAKVYLGIDPLMPRRNYFYGSINKLTLGAVLEAFEIDLTLPTCLRDSGLPKGLEVSFSLDARELVPSGIVIPQGFVLNGTIDILGFQLSAYIDIGLPRGIKIDIRMTPLNLAGGLLKLYKSRSDKSSGPILVADIQAFPLPKVNVTAQGYVSLFWGMIEREIFLQITNTQFVFWIRGRFFLFDALLRVHAPYGSLEEASFQVYGLLSTAWMDEIRRKVLAVIDEAAKKATAEISKAQAKVRAAESKFDAAVADLRAKRNNVNSLCTLKHCGRGKRNNPLYVKLIYFFILVCVGCPSWNSCCTRWWGSCIGCPGWNSCCWRAPNLICEAANLACKGLRGIAYAALWLAEKIVDGSRWTLDVAIGVLEAAKIAVKIGAEAAKFIVNLGLGGIINIKKIEFDVKIGLVTAGHFKGAIVVSFLGKHDVELKFELRLKSVKDMALDLADAVFPGISGRKRREVTEQIRRSLPDYSRRHYLPELYVYRPGMSVQKRRPIRAKSIATSTSFSKRNADANNEEQLTVQEIEDHLKYFNEQVQLANSAPAIPDENSDDDIQVIDVALPSTLGMGSFVHLQR